MKVRFLSSSPKFGHPDEHLPPSVAQALIAAGFAEACPRPNYGTAEYLAEHAEISASARPNPTDVNPTVAGVEWGVRDKDLSPFSKVLVLKRTGATVTYYDAPPADAPLTIVQRFRDLTNTNVDELNANAITAAKKQADANKETERVGVCQKIFASRA